MHSLYRKTRVFITVMTYPHPSTSSDELVCTAGITEDGEWVRLYPINYRYRPLEQRYKKYQWIEVDLLPYGSGNDNRKESRKPNIDTLKLMGGRVSSKNGWSERLKVIDNLPTYTIKQLVQLNQQDKTSLGMVRPVKVLDVKVENTSAQWKPCWQLIFDQVKLFGDPVKPLEKIPYKFSYVFMCEDDTKPHSLMIEDWELGELFRREKKRFGDETRAAESVRHKYLELIQPKYDTRFFLGTVLQHNTWVIIGVCYPPKRRQTELIF